MSVWSQLRSSHFWSNATERWFWATQAWN